MKIYWKTFIKKWEKPKKGQFPVGTRVYKGFQGSGKTLSMVKYAFDIKEKFPKCRIYSNIILYDIEYIFIKDDSILLEALRYSSGPTGCLILLDEAHLFFNKKTGISLDVLTAISQQRKDRKRLIFSSQIWEELDISLRKQVKEIVNCRCWFGFLQINTISNGETLTYNKMEGEWQAKKIETQIFKHNKDLYNKYDTYQKILSNKEYQRQLSGQNYNVVNFTTKKL